VALVALFWACYSLSSYTYGTTNNAANGGLSWGMSDLFPESSYLSINGVFYQYTPVKNTADAMKVHVQNQNALGSGYVFRETDDWTGRAGGIPINKVIGVANVPKELWGTGSIEVEGAGSVKDASVVYSYKYENKCTTPLASQSCPGYSQALLDVLASKTEPVTYNALDDDSVKNVLDEKANLEDKSEQEQSEKEDEGDDRLEKALSAVDSNVLLANATVQAQMMDALALAINIDSYYIKDLEGGTYEDTQTLTSEQLPDNKRGARVGLAQQLMHTKMVDMQYNIGE